MADITIERGVAQPAHNLVTLTHVMYGLHGFSVLMAMLTPAFIITSFLMGWPSIIAVIINYVKREDVRGTLLESHFAWQLRTFWYSVLWVVVAILLSITVVGLVFAFPLLIGLTLWIVYRIIRGWGTLKEMRPMTLQR